MVELFTPGNVVIARDEVPWQSHPLLRGVSEPVLNVSEGKQTGCVME